jgi:hypothetical protein
MLPLTGNEHSLSRDWKEVPWEDDVASKTQLDYLIDILCDYPEDADNVRSLGTLPEN